MLLGGGTNRLLRRSAYMLFPGLLLLLVAFGGGLYLRYTLMIEEVGEDLHEHLDEASKRLQAKGISSSTVAQWLADALEAGLYEDPSPVSAFFCVLHQLARGIWQADQVAAGQVFLERAVREAVAAPAG